MHRKDIGFNINDFEDESSTNVLGVLKYNKGYMTDLHNSGKILGNLLSRHTKKMNKLFRVLWEV